MESSPRLVFYRDLEQKEQEKAVKKTKAGRIYRDIEIFVATKQKLARVQCKTSKVCCYKVSYVVTNPLEINSARQEECRDI